MNDNTKKAFPSNIAFLVLEDMDNLRQQMVIDLKFLGIQGKIFEAATIQTALEICNSEQIGFIISDWNLPDSNGLEFLKKIRSILRYKKTPFIMCTTNDEIHFILEAITNGANEYVVKPWSSDELYKKIQSTWEKFLST